MSSEGIMTLTRAPCELDKMSLFQDLKLKRRKVDSRCSSDGESVADTSTSSPDVVSPASPKMSDATSTTTNLNPPSPDSTPIHSVEPTLDKISSSRLEDSGVFDGGGGGGGGDGGGAEGGGTDMGTNHNNQDLTTEQQQQQQHKVVGGDKREGETVGVEIRVKSEEGNARALEATNMTQSGGTSVIRSLPRSQSPPPIRPAPTSSPLHPPRPHSSPGRPVVPSNNTSPVIRHNPSSHHYQQQQHHPHHHFQQQQQQQQERHQEMPTSSSPKNRSVIISQSPSIQQQQQPVVQPHLSPSLSPNQLWLKHSRINGVKPEIIGGSFATTPTPHLHGGDVKPGSPMNRPLNIGPVRQTPTVIMGEAGGVRTMIWSQPSSLCTTPTSPLGDPHATTSNWPPSTSPNTEESAAQMLLNLGQDRLRLPAANAAVGAGRIAPPSPGMHFNSPLNMERLWAGDLRQLPINQQAQALNLTSPTPPSIYSAMSATGEALGGETHGDGDDEEQPMICMICEDKATGLHYGIITCEGCKGFFKRTVQNRRVYTCVADGNCEITKAQRNRCQYCRFKKCIEQGMVLQAVREDRMPGGRNSGAVYNLYKVKYKKHKKPSKQAAATKTDKHHQLQQQQQQQQIKQEQHLQQQQQSTGTVPVATPPSSAIPANLVNGTILKTALTNPSEVVRLRQRLDSAVSSSRDRNFSLDYSLSMIKTLIDCDEFQDIATLQNLDDLLDHNTDLSEKLCHIGDSIVYKLVQWTKRLPFYLELPVEVHTRLLTHKWHELLVLTTSAYQAIHKAAGGSGAPTSGGGGTATNVATGQEPNQTTIIEDFNQEVENNLCTLQSCLTSMMGREITIEQLRQDVGLMIEKITHVTLMFRQIKLTMEEYVCLKVITMLNQAKPASSSGNSELETIHERYMTCLRIYTQHMYPQQTTRFQDLLVRLPEIQSAASLLLESKMFYVPFLLNSAIQR